MLGFNGHNDLLSHVYSYLKRAIIYSLGNFISTRLYHNPATNCGTIVQLTVKKEPDGKVKVTDFNCIPTWSTRLKTVNGVKYRILPLLQTMLKPDPAQTVPDRKLMSKVWKQTKPILANSFVRPI
jgi:poly-gamma-glutamate capsule biosynthesis protein CapA/YwtB (metallophosphatase superfamily)